MTMGQANDRGTQEERRAQSMAKMLDEAEVLIALSSDDTGVQFQVLPRDETPDQDSPAVILASFINHNFGNLMQTAMAAYHQHQASGGEKPEMIKQRPVLSLTKPDGGLAKEGPVLLGPDGERLQ